MIRRTFRAALLFVAAFAATTAARAHLPNESALVVSTDEENLAVMVSLSLQSATALLPRDAAPLSADTFESHRAALRAAVPRVCTLLDAAGAPLAPERIFVSFRDGHEIRYQLLYARSAEPARLSMPMLAALPAGAFCAVTDLRSPSASSTILRASASDCALSTPAR